MKQRVRDKKTVFIILGVVAFMVLLYTAQDLYFRSTGKLRTEPLFLTSENQVVSSEGFAVRDECRMSENRNISIMKMQTGKVYVPTVRDSASVAAGDTIAVSFSDKDQAQQFRRLQVYEEKMESLTLLQSQESLGSVNVSALNGEIGNALNEYLRMLERNELTDLDEAIRRVNSRISTKLLAAGGKMNVDARLKKYAKKVETLQKSTRSKSFVTTPYAGYFVSTVDGYEAAASYDDVQKRSITPEAIESLLKKKPADTGSAFGKIIGQHTWYFVMRLSITDASAFKQGYSVTVNFPQRGIYDVPMQIHAISERSGGAVAVVLKCTMMNEELSGLRKETAQITVQTHEGFHIRNEALTENNGLTGVFVLMGKRVVFKPIRILYHARDHVIATAAIYYKNNGEIDTEKTPNLPQLENFDLVIVKGKNLYDGKVVS